MTFSPVFFAIAASMFGSATFCLVMASFKIRQLRRRTQNALEDHIRLREEADRIDRELRDLQGRIGTRFETVAEAVARRPETDLAQQLARDKAMLKLQTSLSVKQRQTMERGGFFDVTAMPSGNVYRINTNSPISNISCLTDGSAWCLHLYWPHAPMRQGSDAFPNGDHYLAQALMIRTDEAGFRVVAHRFR